MLIKFTETDPRAGTVAQMDSSRGEQLIAEGAAEAFSESAPAKKAEKPEAPVQKPEALPEPAPELEPEKPTKKAK